MYGDTVFWEAFVKEAIFFLQRMILTHLWEIRCLCMDLTPGPLFRSLVLNLLVSQDHVLLLSWLYGIAWDNFSLYTGNNCASHVVLTILQFLWEMSLEFWWESLRICRSCWECDHCYHNDSANLWPWDVFAASSVPSDFFLQCLKIVLVGGLLLFFLGFS